MWFRDVCKRNKTAKEIILTGRKRSPVEGRNEAFTGKDYRGTSVRRQKRVLARGVITWVFTSQPFVKPHVYTFYALVSIIDIKFKNALKKKNNPQTPEISKTQWIFDIRMKWTSNSPNILRTFIIRNNL